MKQLSQKNIDEILTKQFQMVGQTYSPEVVKENGWYLKYYWTKETENEFKKWLTFYLINGKLVSKKQAEKEVDYFLFYCGFPLEEYRVSG
jgi:hypothetical protein